MSGSSRIAWFYSELKRRHVIRVVVTYAAAAWLVVQIGETTFEPLGLPAGALTFLVILALLGFPIAAVLAWTLQVTRELPAPARGRAGEADGVAAYEQSPTVLANLPAPPTPLVGRVRELEDAERLITAEGCRMLTVLGPAGVGKTRFTLELARRAAARFRNGVCFAAVGRLASVDALPFVLAERLGVGFASGTNAWAATLAFLREKQLLLVIDNFEQLASGSALLGEIIQGAPGVVLVVTSRERLELQGEALLRLDGLPCPQPERSDGAAETDAVRLFVQSARRADRRFVLDAANSAEVGRICRLVEGLPLALELAAACVAVLSPAEIAREIELHHDFPLGSPRDAPARHRSLRAAFESSWSLLGPEEREAFRRLTVFHGGFARGAAEAVTGAGVAALATLVDKSLLRRHDSGRFDMLEVVRQFGREKLAADPTEEASVRERHAEHCTRVLEQLVRQAEAADTEGALATAGWDAENIRAAWSWAVERSDLDRLRRGADGLFRLWDARGWIEEGRELFHRAAAAAGAHAPAGPADPAVAGILLAREGAFAEIGGAYDEGDDLLRRALALLPTTGYDADRAFVLQALSWVARSRGEFESGLAHAHESYQLYERAGDAGGMAAARNSLGAHAYYRGEYDQAKRFFRESLALYRRAGSLQGVWKQLNNMAGVATFEGDYDEARRLLEEILALYRRHGNRPGAARALYNLGVVAARAGRPQEAQDLLEQAVEACREAGLRDVVLQGLISLGDARVALGDRAGALEAFRAAVRGTSEVHHLPLTLEILLGLARLKVREGDRDLALRLVRLPRHHPAADENTRRDAEALLEELGGDDEGYATGAERPDAAALREVALEVLEAGSGTPQPAA